MQSESTKDITDYYKHLSLFWTDIVHLMSSKPQALASIGPMRAFAANSKKISTELIEINEDLMEFNKHLTEYYKQLADTWTEAQKKSQSQSARNSSRCRAYGSSQKNLDRYFR
nr:hypothetical protein [Candidatus Nitrosopumilus koreensis]